MRIGRITSSCPFGRVIATVELFIVLMASLPIIVATLLGVDVHIEMQKRI